ncbi:arrestin domain-containing protein 3-like isoform X2 [Genypterus blacodes]|uniref:arrestin domain-containing protein 3-like isoform X2 n=1 Tax=Genypterus blacodes TaxID=154954 RepID=UPI003F76F67F
MMSSTVKSLKVTYNPVNETNTFTSGDIVSGQVTLEVSGDCQINALLVTFKGKSRVLWSERHGQVTVVYHSKEKYFSIKHYFIRDEKDRGVDCETLLTGIDSSPAYSSVVAPGCHVYPFTFQFPNQEMPSSFDGCVGKIQYSLEAKLSRSMRIPKKELTKINFVTRADLSSVPGLMTPQHESKDKKMKLFTSGTVAMDVDIEKTGFLQGEGIMVQANIQNNSSRAIKPKYCLYRKHSFFAKGRRRLSTKDLLKEVGEPIPPSSQEKVTKVINIPHDCEPSILNCNNIKAEYRLRIPTGQQPPAYGGFGASAFGNPDLRAWGPAQPQQPDANHQQPVNLPPPYASYGMYPPLNEFK